MIKESGGMPAGHSIRTPLIKSLRQQTGFLVITTGPDTCTACTGKHGPGMSYSFGGKQTVEEYNKETGGGVARDCRISGSETEKAGRHFNKRGACKQLQCLPLHQSLLPMTRSSGMTRS